MTAILFVCYGNICRSLMAEFVMKDLTEKAVDAGGYSKDNPNGGEIPGQNKTVQRL